MASLLGQMQDGSASHLKMLMVTKYMKVSSKGVGSENQKGHRKKTVL